PQRSRLVAAGRHDLGCPPEQGEFAPRFVTENQLLHPAQDFLREVVGSAVGVRGSPGAGVQRRPESKPDVGAELVLLRIQQADGDNLQTSRIATRADKIERDPRRPKMKRPESGIGMAHAFRKDAEGAALRQDIAATLKAVDVLAQVGSLALIFTAM